MGYRINTNVAAMQSLAMGSIYNRELDNSLSRLSSGLRINNAADDSSGLSIANSLRAQASGLGQAISNSNDAIGIIQIADRAMEEQIKVLESIRTKATQAAQDGQTSNTRLSIQKDVTRLLDSLDSIATTTSFNGQSLLSGTFTNRKFQIGAYSNQTVGLSIGATDSTKIGQVHYETGIDVLTTAAKDVSLIFSAGTKDIKLASANIDYSSGSGIGALAKVINKATDLTGVKASYIVESTTTSRVSAGDISGLSINGILVGNISSIAESDSDGRLTTAINNLSTQTGVIASIDTQGRMVLNTNDGRGIIVTASNGGLTGIEGGNFGRLTLSRQDAKDIVVDVSTNGGLGGLSDIGHKTRAEATLNLTNLGGNFTSADALAIGVGTNSASDLDLIGGIGAGVTSLKGAMAVMDIAQSAQSALDSIRADLGSVQNQLTSTVNNIAISKVNVSSAESTIRDVDFAQESANFTKLNILTQAGTFALTQANNIQQNVLRLLQ